MLMLRIHRDKVWCSNIFDLLHPTGFFEIWQPNSHQAEGPQHQRGFVGHRVCERVCVHVCTYGVWMFACGRYVHVCVWVCVWLWGCREFLEYHITVLLLFLINVNIAICTITTRINRTWIHRIQIHHNTDSPRYGFTTIRIHPIRILHDTDSPDTDSPIRYSFTRHRFSRYWWYLHSETLESFS